LVKVGRVRIRFPGSPFPAGAAGGGGFRATLDLASATLHVTGGSGFSARLWVDANSPVLRISAQGLGSGKTVQVSSELWRLGGAGAPAGRTPSAATDVCATGNLSVANDVVMSEPHALAWYHRNGPTDGFFSHSSLWESELRLQGLGSLVDNPPHGMPPDPLTNSTFGAAVVATNGQQHKPAAGWNRTTMQIDAADGVRSFGLVSRLLQTDTAAVFEKQLSADAARLKATDLGRAYAAHGRRPYSATYLRAKAAVQVSSNSTAAYS